MLSINAFEEIRLWIYRNARRIELALWQYEFENGSVEAVLSALSNYQNADGGFGNAIEPDCWNPASSPYATLNAIGKLKSINFTDTDHPIMRGIFKYLENGEHSNDNGWLFNIPSNNDYPCAPWWTYDPEANEYEHTGVTAGIVCFVLQFADKNFELYKRSFVFAEKLLSKFAEPGNKGDMGLFGYCALLETVNKLGLSNALDIKYLSSNIKKYVDDEITRDVSKWAGYCVRPSGFIQSPDSPFYAGNEEIVEVELDYLIETRPAGGVWGITWHWHDNYAKYPEEFAISKNWWKSDYDIGATGKLKFLRNFGRLEALTGGC